MEELKITMDTIDRDAQKSVKDNKKLMEIFEEFFEGYKVVIHSYKGIIEAYIVNQECYDKYDLWDFDTYAFKSDLKLFPYERVIGDSKLTKLGTRAIITTIIRICHMLPPIFEDIVYDEAQL
jgi:hypothetical protein